MSIFKPSGTLGDSENATTTIQNIFKPSGTLGVSGNAAQQLRSAAPRGGGKFPARVSFAAALTAWVRPKALFFEPTMEPPLV